MDCSWSETLIYQPKLEILQTYDSHFIVQISIPVGYHKTTITLEVIHICKTQKHNQVIQCKEKTIKLLQRGLKN